MTNKNGVLEQKSDLYIKEIGILDLDTYKLKKEFRDDDNNFLDVFPDSKRVIVHRSEQYYDLIEIRNSDDTQIISFYKVYGTVTNILVLDNENIFILYADINLDRLSYMIVNVDGRGKQKSVDLRIQKNNEHIYKISRNLVLLTDLENVYVINIRKETIKKIDIKFSLELRQRNNLIFTTYSQNKIYIYTITENNKKKDGFTMIEDILEIKKIQDFVINDAIFLYDEIVMIANYHGADYGLYSIDYKMNNFALLANLKREGQYLLSFDKARYNIIYSNNGNIIERSIETGKEKVIFNNKFKLGYGRYQYNKLVKIGHLDEFNALKDKVLRRNFSSWLSKNIRDIINKFV